MRSLVILPTYNEAQNLPRLIPEIFSRLPQTDILVIDDNSPDGSGRIAEELSKRNARLAVLRRPSKMGLGSAYLAGFRYALEHRYDAVIQMDSDFSHAPQELPRLLQELGSCDWAIGSRYVKGGAISGWSLRRLWLSACANFYARTILNVDIRDLTGGYKCFKRKVLEALNLNSIVSEGYAFQIEVNVRLLSYGFIVKEIPIVFTERSRGKSKFSFGIVLEAFWIVWRLRFFTLKPR